MWIFSKKRFIKTHIYPELLKFSKFIYTLWSFGSVFSQTNVSDAKMHFIYRYTAPDLNEYYTEYTVYKDSVVKINNSFENPRYTGSNRIVNLFTYRGLLTDSTILLAKTIYDDDEEAPFKFHLTITNTPNNSELKHIYEILKSGKLLNIVYRNCILAIP